MKYITPEYCKNFKCIGSECKNNCCIGWEVCIDDLTKEFYRSVNGSFGEKLKKYISFCGEPHFILDQTTGRCPFLNNNNLCDIIIDLGEEHLCDICREHPRFYEWFEYKTEMGMGLCCEEACRLFFELENPMKFNVSIIYDHDETEPYDENFFKSLNTSRKIIFNILSDNEYSLEKSLVAILMMGEEIQNAIFDEEYDLIDTINMKYKSKKYINSCFSQALKHKLDISVFDFSENLLQTFTDMIPVDEKWIDFLHELIDNKAFISENLSTFNEYYRDKQYQYKNLLKYFVYRYFLKAVFDYDAVSKLKSAVVGFLMINFIDTYFWLKNNGVFNPEDRIKSVQMYSKEMEYSDLNMDTISDEMYINSYFSTETLISVIHHIQN